jgi:hypothetical protein
LCRQSQDVANIQFHDPVVIQEQIHIECPRARSHSEIISLSQNLMDECDGQADDAASADGYIIPRPDETLNGLFQVHTLVRIGSLGLGEHVTAEIIRGDFRENLSAALFKYLHFC